MTYPPQRQHRNNDNNDGQCRQGGIGCRVSPGAARGAQIAEVKLTIVFTLVCNKISLKDVGFGCASGTRAGSRFPVPGTWYMVPLIKTDYCHQLAIPCSMCVYWWSVRRRVQRAI